METAKRDVQARINIVLVHPEIPPNTGNIARLCGATSSVLHLVHPLGFRLDDRHLKRAGLDYWDKVEIREHSSLEEFLEFSRGKTLILLSTRGKRPYTEAPFEPECFLLFGSETTGLPKELLEKFKGSTFYIPIWGEVRSLNLSTSVGIMAYEAYRVLGFGPHLKANRLTNL